MKKYTVADVEQQFIDHNNTNLKGFHPIPLKDIEVDFSDFSEMDIASFKEAIVNIIVGSKEHRPLTKPDPIAAILMNVDRDIRDPRMTVAEYNLFESTRIADKWRGNHIGKLNELICCLQPNIEKSKSGLLDVIVKNDSNEIIAIAEVKNRFNTMNAASAIRTRQAMESLVLEKGATFYGCDAVLVERIPKKNGSDIQFNPSDPSRGQKGKDTDKIKRMGLHQFLLQYGKTKNAYITAIILLAHTLNEQGVLPKEYDMRFIFDLLGSSLL